MDTPISPRDHAEAVALFRAEIVGLSMGATKRGNVSAPACWPS